MKRFLQTAFKITLFQIIAIVLLSTLKYIFTTYKIIDKIQKPFILVCAGIAVIFIFAVSIIGIIEKRGQSFEELKVNPKKSKKEKFMANFISWGITISIMFAYVLFLYIIAPTSVYMFIALYAGIVIRNSITFFSEKRAPLP